MSEHAPEQEPQHNIENPIHFECPECSSQVTSTFSNTLNVTYTKQPWFNHIRLVCDSGDYVGVMWYDQQEGVQECAEQFMQMPMEFCDDQQLHELRVAATGAVEPELHEFSDRKERFINNWGAFLQSSTVDITDFA